MIGGISGFTKSAQARRHCPHHYGVGNMKAQRNKLTEEEVMVNEPPDLSTDAGTLSGFRKPCWK
jgi:hypothetical protein